MAARPTEVTTASPAKMEGKKKKARTPKLDTRPHYERAVFFVSIFVGVFAFVRESTLRSRNYQAPPGPKFFPERKKFVSETMLVATTLSYVAFVVIGCRFMRNRKSYDSVVRKLQPIYNLVQIVVCAYMVYGLAPTVGVWNGKAPFALNSAFSEEIEHFVFIHYLTKYLDWCDTFFMITKKKFNQVSFLHVFHHATIGVIWGFLLNEGVGSGTAGFGAFMNSLTHVIMYTHYLVTSFGINNPFKRYITKWQLVQFATCLLHSFVALALEKTLPTEYAWLQTMYQSFMLMLFGLYMSWIPAWLTGDYPVIAQAEKVK